MIVEHSQEFSRGFSQGKSTSGINVIEWYIMNSTFKIKGSWYFYELHATYYNSGNSLAYCPSKDLWRGYYEGSGSISSIKLGWHDIG